VNFLIVFYLQGVRGYDPLKAALLLLPMPLIMAFVAPVSGILSDKVGAKVPATLGVLIQAVALFWLTFLSPETPYIQIAFALMLMGLGGGMFYSPNTSAAMNAAPRNRLGIASGALATLRQTGMVTSLALAMAVTATTMPQSDMMKLFVGTNVELGSGSLQSFVIGMHGAFTVSIALSLVAAIFSLIRGKEDRSAPKA
jgi:MFS family permease